MKLQKKRCAQADCHQWFSPDPRTIRGDEEQACQRYCSKAACKKASAKEAQAKWLAKNPDYFKGEVHKEDCQAWRKENQDYWKNYRDDNPDYVDANRQRQKIRDRRRSFLAKKDLIAQNPLGHIESTRLLAQKNLAKKDVIRLPLEGILDFLEVKESLAKKDERTAEALVAA